MISFCIALGFFSIITSILVVISANPVYSVFFLILSFILTCGNLFCLELEFLPLIFIVVYVGAISVLFLFIIMMLDIKFVEKQQQKFASIVVAFFFFLIFCGSVFFNVKDTVFVRVVLFDSYFDWFYFIDKFTDLNIVGQYLYTDFIVHFLVVGLILLVSIIGAVVLTVQLNNPNGLRGQHLFKQVARTNLESFYVTR
jgi:NADH-quinone oxidoreductase subunit J